MDKRTIILVVAFFSLIVVGMFGYAYLKKSELTVVTAPVATSTSEINLPYGDITRIDAKHFYIDGVHTYVGEIQMPTPCDLLTVESMVRESMPEQISLAFMVVNNADSCAEVITTQRFKVGATASEAAITTAIFMGRAVELNLIPAQPGETPDEFEIYIKG